MERWNSRVLGAFAVAGSVQVATVMAQPNDPSGIEFVTIGAAGNRGYDREPTGGITGWGAVDYEYRIGKYEITTAQWVEFVNTFKARADPVPDSVVRAPITWGAERDPTYTGPGVRYRVRSDLANAAMVPVGSLDWRTAARYCNWQHNDRSSMISALADGAYDTSTFGQDANGNFTDQVSRHPNARFWIPSIHEWMKAVHYDPNRVNDDGSVGGWWLQPNGTDTPLRYGLPPSMGGDGQANAGFRLPGFAELLIPLGSYPRTLTPWGLMDAAGAAPEWTESILVVNNSNYRISDGTYWGSFPGGDLVYAWGTDRPYSLSINHGLRVVSVVPSASSVAALASAVVVMFRRLERRVPERGDSR